MFLSEWREFPSAPCLAGKKTWWELASRCCWNRAPPWRASELVSFLVGLRTYQHPGISGKIILKEILNKYSVSFRWSHFHHDRNIWALLWTRRWTFFTHAGLLLAINGESYLSRTLLEELSCLTTLSVGKIMLPLWGINEWVWNTCGVVLR